MDTTGEADALRFRGSPPNEFKAVADWALRPWACFSFPLQSPPPTQAAGSWVQFQVGPASVVGLGLRQPFPRNRSDSRFSPVRVCLGPS